MNYNGQNLRSEIPSEYKWNIEAMYPDEKDMEKDLNSGLELASSFETLQGHIMDSSSNLLDALDLYVSSMRLMEKAYVYAHMKHDEDNTDSKYSEMYNKALSVISEASARMSFLQPEILEADTNTVRKYVREEPGLSVYEYMLDEIMIAKEHTLTAEQEFIVASYGEVLTASRNIFGILNNADLDFGTIRTSDGKDSPLTHATYVHFMESDDREIRKAAFEAMYEEYKSLNNTISALYTSNVKRKTISSKLRKYESSLDAALSPSMIPLSVYDNLIDAVHDSLPAMHKYVGIRKKVLGLDEMHMWDVYTPIVKPEDRTYTYEEAVKIACEALKPLGDEYVRILENGLKNEKWVDIYENKGKTSGAYSFGSYDSYPYILMNFTGKLRDIFTLVHEGGHSMHSYYTRRTQPYIYGDHSIFTAEVASTVNETLLIHYLLDNCSSEQEKAYLINFYIDEFKSTLFRQTMFAEFEKLAHEYEESGGSLTAEWLNSTYDKLNTEYFGPEMSHDDMIQYEWSRIPHFYNAFYVYQYATGYSAANAIANRILNEGKPAREDYLRFLTTGSSDYPIELLKIAGVDMSRREPVQSALSTFTELVDELDELTRG